MKTTVFWGVSTYAFHYFNVNVMISSKYCTVYAKNLETSKNKNNYSTSSQFYYIKILRR